MIPAGFAAKIIATPEDWLGNASVAEILSISECMSESPIDHTDLWLCNQWLLYDSETTLAEAIARTPVDPNRLRWFFYEVHEEELEDGKWRPIGDYPENVTPPEAGYSMRGFDIVCFTTGATPECSPLSCNLGADRFPVNRFCLLDTLEQGIEDAGLIDRDGGYEPGPYRVMSVSERNSRPSRGGGSGDPD
jgi:hypothetical protein